MSGFKKFLTTFPSWSFTIIWLVVMIWININPEPLVGSSITVAHNADKIGHLVVAGMLAALIMLDYQRRHHWRQLSTMNILVCAGVALVISTAMEFAQLANFIFGRLFEVADLLSQIAGIAIFSLLYFVCQRRWMYREG